MDQPGAEVDVIYDYKGRKIIEKGEKFGTKLLVDKIEIRNTMPQKGGVSDEGGQGHAEIVVTITRVSKRAIGGSNIQKRLSILIKTHNDLPDPIYTCVSAQDADIIPKDKTYLVTKKNPGTPGVSCGSNCLKWTASCNPGDQALAGDCIVHDGNSDDTWGDLDLAIGGSDDCSGCPDDEDHCAPVCLVNEYTGYTCKYYNSSSDGASGARILCLDRTF